MEQGTAKQQSTEQMINYLLGVMGELGRRILHVDAQSAQRYALTIERLSNAIARLALYQVSAADHDRRRRRGTAAEPDAGQAEQTGTWHHRMGPLHAIFGRCCPDCAPCPLNSVH